MTRARSLPSVVVGALALGLVPASARAHETWELWTDLGVRVTPVRRLRVSFTHLTRFNEDGLRRLGPEVEVDYRLLGPLRLGAGYRYLLRRNSFDEVEQGHRLHGEASVGLSLWRFDFDLRSRLQWRIVDRTNHGRDDLEDRSYWRNRFVTEFNLPGPFAVSAGVEHFTRLDFGLDHDRFRLEGALTLRAARWRFEVFYYRDLPWYEADPTVNVLGLSARWNLDLTRGRRANGARPQEDRP